MDPAKYFAETIRAQVQQATSCEGNFLTYVWRYEINPSLFIYIWNVSIGISHNILLARLAIRHAEPAGSYHLVRAEIPEFLAPLDIADLYGLTNSKTWSVHSWRIGKEKQRYTYYKLAKTNRNPESECKVTDAGRSLALKIMGPYSWPKYILFPASELGWYKWFTSFFSSSSWVMGPAISLINKLLLLVLEEDPQAMIRSSEIIMHGEILQFWCERATKHRDTGAKTKRRFRVPPKLLEVKSSYCLKPNSLLSGRSSKLLKPDFHLISSLIVHLIRKRGIFNLLSWDSKGKW